MSSNDLSQLALEKPTSLTLAEINAWVASGQAEPPVPHAFSPSFIYKQDGTLFVDEMSDSDPFKKLGVSMKEVAQKYKSLVLCRGVFNGYFNATIVPKGLSGTNFPLTPAYTDPSAAAAASRSSSNGYECLWGSAAHCLEECGSSWRGSTQTDVNPRSIVNWIRDCRRVDLDPWLRSNFGENEFHDFAPSQMQMPVEERRSLGSFTGGETVHRPDIGIAATCWSEGLLGGRIPVKFFVPDPCFAVGTMVSVLGYATEHMKPMWAREKLVTQQEYWGQHKQELSDGETMMRMLLLRERCWFPGSLAASPGRMEALNDRVVEHTCSTFPGMSGSPGVNLQKPHHLHFIHVQGTLNPHANVNVGLHVNHPMFACMYVKAVLPKLTALPTAALAFEEDVVPLLHAYLDRHCELLNQKQLWHEAQEFKDAHPLVAPSE